MERRKEEETIINKSSKNSYRGWRWLAGWDGLIIIKTFQTGYNNNNNRKREKRHFRRAFHTETKNLAHLSPHTEMKKKICRE
jgi:hypothetical protein